MKTRYLLALTLSTAALVACGGGDVQGPSGGGSPTGTSGGGTSGNPGSTSGGTTSGGTSGGTTSGGSSSGNPVQSETWSTGKQITSNVDIVAGATVSIDPGAKITASSGATITVHGTLTASAKTSHASITGTGWGGIKIAQGGTLNLVGVDLGGAGLIAQAGDAAAEYDYGTITGGAFTVEAGATLKTNHAAVVKGGPSAVAGSFTATFLDYAGPSLTASDPSAVVSVADSKITGVGGDFFTQSAGKLIHLEYTTISGTHCPIHFDAVTQFQLDHVATTNNAYGFMIYNDDPGPHTISYSSFSDPNFDQTGRNAKITIDHTYIKNIGPNAPVGQVTITSAASSPVLAAAPRGTPGPNG